MYTLLLILSLFTFVHAQEGNGLDPHGGVRAGKIARDRAGKAVALAQSDEGVGIDPFGRTSAQSGPGMDPNGGGGAMDPNGR